MQFIRMITISVLAGLIAAGLVWLLWDFVCRLRAEAGPPPAKDEE